MKDDDNIGKDELVQLVSFSLGDEEYGINILMVQEINRMVEITRTPELPEHVEGVINLRGIVIPVICLRKKFGLDIIERNKDSRIVVCDIDGSMVGMIVDLVSEVLRVPGSTVDPPPELATSARSDYISGIVRREESLLILLDVKKIATEISNEVKKDVEQNKSVKT